MRSTTVKIAGEEDRITETVIDLSDLVGGRPGHFVVPVLQVAGVADVRGPVGRRDREDAKANLVVVDRGDGEAGFRGEVDFCGSWELLDLVRRERPGQMVHYSIDSADDAERLFRLAENGAPGITIHRDLLTAERAAWLRERGFDVIAWDIATREQALAAIELGASGIIADDLAMLRAIAGTPLKGDARQ